MPIALGKVQKHIRKKKGSLSALGDRDVKRVSRAALRDKKLKHQAGLRRHERENDCTEPVRAGACGFLGYD